jgi:hypothetical protein
MEIYCLRRFRKNGNKVSSYSFLTGLLILNLTCFQNLFVVPVFPCKTFRNFEGNKKIAFTNFKLIQ